MLDVTDRYGKGFALGEDIRNAPRRNALADLALQSQQQSLASTNQLMNQRQSTFNQQNTQFDQGQVFQRSKVILKTMEALERIPDEQTRRSVLQQAMPELQKFGVNIGDASQIPLDTQSIQNYKASVSGLVNDPKKTTAIATFERQAAAAGLKPGTPEYEKAARIALKLESGAGSLTKDERIASDAGMTSSVAQSQATIEGAKSGAKEEAKLGVQLKLEPQITRANEEVKAAVQKRLEQEGQKNKLEDVQFISDNLLPKNSDGSYDLSTLKMIYGKGEGLYPKMLRSQKGVDALAQRDQLIGILKLAARGELKGQGPITEGEQAILGQAVTMLEEPDISPELAAKQIVRAFDVIKSKAGVNGQSKALTPEEADDFINSVLGGGQ